MSEASDVSIEDQRHAKSTGCFSSGHGSNWMRTADEYGVIDENSEVEGFGACLYNAEYFESGLKSQPATGGSTVYETLELSVDRNRDTEGFGYRELVEVHEVEEGGKTFEKLEFENHYTWYTYGDYWDRVQELGSGMAALGLKPQDKLVMYAETQLDWMVCAYAAWRNSAQVTTIYATLGEEGAEYGINQTKATMVVADRKLLKVVANVLPQCPSVKNVIFLGSEEVEENISRTITGCGAQLNGIENVIALGVERPCDPRPPTAQDVAVIMYTSGTTGKPKGVMISHENAIAAIAACVEVGKFGAFSSDDTMLAYLPLAHIFGLVVEATCVSMGVKLGYGSPHPLTDTGVKLKRPESIGDAPCLKPTLMVFAPAILDKVYVGVKQKFAELPGPLKTLAEWGIDNGKHRFDNNAVGANGLYNLLFKKVQALVGGRLKCALAGSAPLSPDIQKYVQTVFAAPIRQGYGLTETCAASCVQFWGDSTCNCVGPPTSSTVIRLADWPEGNYMNSDENDEEIGMRRGEVLIGGASVSMGYYIDPANPDEELVKKNKEDWVEIQGMRFFRSGDIGQILPNGTLQIIDRKKDLWKGPNGEYVALTKVESALKCCEFTEIPMCYGKTGGEYPVALICPLKKKILELGKELGCGDDFDALCREPKVVERVSKACLAACKAQKLQAFEIPQKLALISDTWTPDNDMLTAAMKLKRPIIAQKHKADIDKLYAK